MRRSKRTQARRVDRPATSRERKAARQNTIGAMLLFAAVIVIAAFLYLSLSNEPVKIVKETNCPESGPVSYTAVIVDTTDSINPIQKIAIENEFAGIRSNIPRFGALAIYAVGATGEVVRPDFELCNPGTAEQIDWLTEGRHLAANRWRQGFEQPLDTILDKMLAASSADKTPLLEAIQSVSVLGFGHLLSSGRNVPKTLIIFSDMLQHSGSLSLYSRVPSSKEFIGTEEYRKVRSDLRDVEVSIRLIRRQTRNAIQGPKLIEFWTDVIAAQGGQVVHFKPVEG